MLIQIRWRGFERRFVERIFDGARAVFKLAMMFMLPLLTLLAGIVVWRRQKIRRLLLPLQYRES